MFKKITFLATLMMCTYLPASQAAWKVNIENDIFSNGKTAELIGEIKNTKQSIIFDCSQNKLAFSQVEENMNTTVKQGGKFKTLLKVDDNPPVTFTTTLARRDPQAIQLTSTEADKIVQVLSQLMQQRSSTDFLTGVTDTHGKQLSSGAGSVNSAKKALKKFIAACDITL
ncbi:MAG: hypothetical protein RSE29_19165, partial [Leclercia sp.]